MQPFQPIPTAAGRAAPVAAPPRTKVAARPAKVRLDLLRVALFSFIVVSVSTIQAYFGPLRILHVGMLTFGMTFGALLINPQVVRWQNVTATWPGRAICWLVVVACLSAPFGLSIGGSGQFLLHVYFRNIVFFFVMIAAVRSVWDVRWFTWAFVISAGILGVLSVTVMDMSATLNGAMRISSSQMYDANDLGLIFVVTIPLAILLFYTSAGWQRLVAVGCLGSIVLGTALTGSRGAFVGLVFITPFLFWSMKQIALAKRVAVLVVIAGGLVLAAPKGYWESMASIFDTETNYNYTATEGRIEIAKRGLGYMVRHPLFGVGIANFARAEGTISTLAQNASAGDKVVWIAPHNTYVQVGAELGVTGLLLWLSVMWSGTIGLYRLRRRWRLDERKFDRLSDASFLDQATTYVPVSVLGFASTSFFVSHAYTPIVYILVAIVAGVLVHLTPPASANRAAAYPARRTR